jgi:putative membrane protein
MYWRGGRPFRAARRAGVLNRSRVRRERWRTLAFACASITTVLALAEPLDGLADELFWVHMVQHVLLLAIAPPLAMLAAPWMRLWRAIPLSLRRALARWGVQAPGAWPLRGLARVLGEPLVAWGLLAGDLIAWHIPAAYDLTLRSEVVHYTEHASFLGFALLAWGQVIDSPPFRSALDAPRRIAFALGSMVVGWALALLLAFATRPWYAPYADLRHRSGGISALTDQHLGAGVMWVPASLPWALLVFVQLYRWLAEGEGRRLQPARAGRSSPEFPRRPGGHRDAGGLALSPAPHPVERLPDFTTAGRTHA